MALLETFAPIFLVIGLGWLLARQGLIGAGALKQLNWLTYWVAMPAFLFHSIAGANHQLQAASGLLFVTVLATLLAMLAAALLGPMAGIAKASRGTFVQGVFRGNLGFIGLPIIIYAFSATGPSGGGAEASALLVFGPMVVLYNLFGVLVLLPADSGGLRRGLGIASREWLRNPILISCVAGLCVSLGGWSTPPMVERSFTIIGQMALPLALLCIGGTLHSCQLRGRIRLATTASLMKVALLPSLGLLIAGWVGLSDELTRVALILLACPTASATYVLACQLDGDEALASGIVVISNLLAIPAMFGVLAATA
jgi:predicted permease